MTVMTSTVCDGCTCTIADLEGSVTLSLFMDGGPEMVDLHACADCMPRVLGALNPDILNEFTHCP